MKDFEDLFEKNELISNFRDTFYVFLYDKTEVEKQRSFMKILDKVSQIMK
jgi:hypothetical protein